MKIGDLVQYQDKQWFVRFVDPRRSRTAHLLYTDGTSVEIPYDLAPPELTVLANPSTEWPFIMVPEKPRWGKVESVSRVTMQGLVELTPFQDWVLADPLRSGGGLFLRPGLRLRIGDQLHVRYVTGFAVTASVTAAFASVEARRAKSAKKAQEIRSTPTTFDRLLVDDEEDLG